MTWLLLRELGFTTDMFRLLYAFLSSFMTCQRMFKMRGTAYYVGTSEFSPVFSGCRVVLSFGVL